LVYRASLFVLKKNGKCIVWSHLADIQTRPEFTTDFIYLRLIGDRGIPEEELGKIQKNRDKEMRYWAGEINKLSKKTDKVLKVGIAAENNHHVGFGPASADMFRRTVRWLEAIGSNLLYLIMLRIKFSPYSGV